MTDARIDVRVTTRAPRDEDRLRLQLRSQA